MWMTGIVTPLLAASLTLFAQSNDFLVKSQSYSTVPEVRQIVESSIAATERHWQTRLGYTYIERDEDRRLDSEGHVKSKEVDISRTILVNGVPFEQLLEHNGHPPSAEQQRKEKEKLDKLKRETPAQRTERLRKQAEDNTSLVREVPKAFDFRLVGEEVVNGRPAYVLQATPHPGYQAQGKYGKMFAKVEGKLWVDKQDLGWIKADGQVIQPFSIWIVPGARAARLSHYDGTDARRRRDLDAGTRRDTSGRENLLHQEPGDRSGPDLFGIQDGAQACPRQDIRRSHNVARRPLTTIMVKMNAAPPYFGNPALSVTRLCPIWTATPVRKGACSGFVGQPGRCVLSPLRRDPDRSRSAGGAMKARNARLFLWLGGAALAFLVFVRITRELIEGDVSATTVRSCLPWQGSGPHGSRAWLWT